MYDNEFETKVTISHTLILIFNVNMSIHKKEKILNIIVLYTDTPL